MGYDVEFIIFDEPKKDIKTFMDNVKKIKGKNSWGKVLKVAKIVYDMAKSMDKVEKIVEVKRAYECNRGEFTRAWHEIMEEYRKIESSEDVRRVEKEAIERLNSIKVCEVPEEEKIRIGIVGEIYVVMEPSINGNIEEVLNTYGAEVERSHYISEWIDFNLIPLPSYKEKEHQILKKGEKYIEIIIGGHAKQSVGAIIDFMDRGFDGVIHLKPFGCLPELITESAINKIKREYDYPILTLSIDEQMAIANTLTRIEAFLDVIRLKKRKKRIVR